MTEITNPDFISRACDFMDGRNIVQCNKSKDVIKFIKTGKKYVIELPDSKRILNVICSYAAMRAADMTIKSEYIDGKKNPDEEEYTISYQYEHFDSINYDSFAYREKCIVYMSIDDLF
jgi:hypothetical protein